MEEMLNLLSQNVLIVNGIGDKIENQEANIEDIRGYVPSLNQMMLSIFKLIQDSNLQFQINQDFIVQVLNDILYGIENEDFVFLLDVLRYGLLEIYEYIGSELQSGGLS